MNTPTLNKDQRKHAAIQGATFQHTALFRTMAASSDAWHLYAVSGTHSGVAIHAASEGETAPVLVPNVHAMTAATMATKINTAWPEQEARSVSAPYGPAQERTQ